MLTNSEGNHGEDVKEYLYKYPQAAYPYVDLIETSRRRTRHEFEYELLETGVMDQGRYFDVFDGAGGEAHPDGSRPRRGDHAQEWITAGHAGLRAS